MFAAAGKKCSLLLIIDIGLGRDGVLPENAPQVAKSIASVPGVQLDGIMTHEGTVYASADQEELESKSREVAELMVRTADSIRQEGLEIPRVSMGASASARFAATVPGVSQVRPGIFAFNDLGQVALGNASLGQVAVRVIVTVVSRPTATSAVIDGGSKTFSQDLLPAREMRGQYPGHGLIIDKPGWIIDRLSEEHGMLRFVGDGEPPSLEIGEKVQVIPNHICTVFSSLNECIPVSSGKVQAAWHTFAPGASR
jgi:D-serine deaminase-like pyridoxal phosphate-dependent protein